MQVKNLNLQEFKNVYYKMMLYDFPSNELRPFAEMQEGFKEGLISCTAMLRDSEIMAYAVLGKSEKDADFALLDYLAVNENYRSQGIGSKMLHELFSANKGTIYLEVENPEAAKSEEDRLIREKRMRFYEKNGCKQSDYLVKIYDDDFCLLYNRTKADKLSFKEAVNQLFGVYKRVLSPVYLKNCHMLDEDKKAKYYKDF